MTSLFVISPVCSPSDCLIVAGTQAAKAMTAPRHKVKQQRRRLAKKPAKTRGFLQAGADPRQALWHPPASPYGLLEEVLYEDPWKLLVACMLLNVTSGLQVGVCMAVAALSPAETRCAQHWQRQWALP